jgi:hypothetical protein
MNAVIKSVGRSVTDLFATCWLSRSFHSPQNCVPFSATPWCGLPAGGVVYAHL